jgi:signal peptide peptidase SppA
MSENTTIIVAEVPAAESVLPVSPSPSLPISLSSAAGVRASHIEQYFGPWCVIPERFVSQVELLQGSNVLEHIQNRRDHQTVATKDNGDYELINNQIAMLHATGTLTKYGTSYGDETSTVALRRQVRLCMEDDLVKGVLLRIESPGGTCAGTQELADDLAALAAKKPVYAWCEDLCCSAAYWIASQCTKIFCNATSLVGCIGTYAVVQDMSGMAEKLGVKVHVVKAGEFKGAATPGTEVTDKQLAEYQNLVDTLNEFFLDAVAAGRKLPAKKVRQLADGRVHVGQEAVTLGLADGVKTFEETIDALFEASAQDGATQQSKNQSTGPDAKPQACDPASPSACGLAKGTPHMAETSTNTQPTAATLAELKAALPGAKSKFILQCLEDGLTVSQAVQKHMTILHAENLRLRAEKKAKADEDEAAELDEEDDDDEEDEDDDEDGEPKPKKRAKAAKPCKGKAEGDGDDEPAEPKGGKPKSRRQPGIDPAAASRRRGSADARSEFDALVLDMMSTLKCDRRRAVALVARQNPALHEDVLRGDPRNRGAAIQKLIGQRFSEPIGAN